MADRGNTDDSDAERHADANADENLGVRRVRAFVIADHKDQHRRGDQQHAADEEFEDQVATRPHAPRRRDIVGMPCILQIAHVNQASGNCDHRRIAARHQFQSYARRGSVHAAILVLLGAMGDDTLDTAPAIFEQGSREADSA